MKELEHLVTGYVPQEWPCPYNSSTGQTDCNDCCVSLDIPEIECPERVFYRAKRRLSCIRRRAFLKLAFSNINFSTSYDLFDEDCIYSEK
jgi:hypothetical protein